MNEAPLLFVNAGWQTHYAGTKGDPTTGGFGYLREHSMGHEAWNFLPRHGKVYGYIPRETAVREPLGGSRRDATVDGVTVVWLARHISTGRTVIVGWYKNAIVHRSAGAIAIRRDGHDVAPQIVAKAEDARLLPIDQRTFEIPTKKEPGCLGQSPVWYGRDEAFRAQVRTFIRNDGRHPHSGPGKSRGAGRHSDPAARKLIEVAAVKFATRYYRSVEGGERKVESVEKDALGWDLNAFGVNDCLKVEVKGVSGDDCSVEVTPNEFKAMMSPEHRDHYVVFVVTGLAGSKPQAHIFRFDRDASSAKNPVWVSQRGQLMIIEPRLAARLSIARR